MKKSYRYLLIFIFCISIGNVNITSAQSLKFENFISGLNKITLPFSTEPLTYGKKVVNDFFYFERGNDYYELQDLKSFGYFKQGELTFVLYSFDLEGLGEGQARDMVILSSFSKEGKHLEDITLGGHNGGEGGAYFYERAVVTDKDIVVHLTDEHYESDTGLPYPIIEYKKRTYKFDKNYNLEEETYRCDSLKNLKEYHLELKKGYIAKDQSKYGLSYKLDNYLHCFPITKENEMLYTDISKFLYSPGNDAESVFLTKAIKNATLKNDIVTVSVDNLRLRNNYNLKGKVIELLPLNSKLTFTRKKSSYLDKITLNGEKMSDYWYKVKTITGNEGWVHGCCISFY